MPYPYVKQFKKRNTATQYWKSIGSQARWVYLNMFLREPERYMYREWGKLPKVIRRLLSFEMNRLQGKHNRRKVTISNTKRKRYGIRTRRKLPLHNIDPVQWDRLYLHEYKHPRAVSIRKRIYARPGVKTRPVADININPDVSATPKDSKKYNRYMNPHHEQGRWMKTPKFEWGLHHKKWESKEKTLRRQQTK